MRLSAVLTLLVGTVVAGSAVVYTHAFMRAPIAHQAMRDVVVAKEEIPFGQMHRFEVADMLTTQVMANQRNS